MKKSEAVSMTQDEALTVRLLATATAVVEDLTERCAAAEADAREAERARLAAEGRAAADGAKSRTRILHLEALVAELRSALRVVAADLAEQSQVNAAPAEPDEPVIERVAAVDHDAVDGGERVSRPPPTPILKRIMEDAAGAANEHKARMSLLHGKRSRGAPDTAERAVA